MIIGRPVEFDRAVALGQAKRLFWRKGYANTSLADLLATMKLSKSSFYQAFQSKHDIFEKSIELYLKERTKMMRAELKSSPSGYAFIAKMLYSVAESSNVENSTIKEFRIGCLVMNTACEFGQSDYAVAQAVRNSMEAFKQVFQDAVIVAQQQGDIPSDKDPDSLAGFLVSSMSGLNTASKAGADDASLKSIASVALSALK